MTVQKQPTTARERVGYAIAGALILLYVGLSQLPKPITPGVVETRCRSAAEQVEQAIVEGFVPTGERAGTVSAQLLGAPVRFDCIVSGPNARTARAEVHLAAR